MHTLSPIPASIPAVGTANATLDRSQPVAPPAHDATREAFVDFVGQTFFGQMFKAMRSTQGKPPYFHGGQAEEIFRNQLDEVLVERMSEATGDTIAGPMFELFQLRRQ